MTKLVTLFILGKQNEESFSLNLAEKIFSCKNDRSARKLPF